MRRINYAFSKKWQLSPDFFGAFMLAIDVVGQPGKATPKRFLAIGRTSW
jgi:hypothetical protein